MDNYNFETGRQPGRVYNEQEMKCEILFSRSCPFFHLSTSEQMEALLTCDKDYQTVMSIIAICAWASPGIRIYTFAVMSNHFHFLIEGAREDVEAFFTLLKKSLISFAKSEEKTVDLKRWDCDIRQIESLEDFRNVVCYDNRNGYLACCNDTPFSYEWGANRFFFSKDAKKRAMESTRKITVREVRKIMTSCKYDKAAGMVVVDGSISPMNFCAIAETESMFRDARHYFGKISKDLEAIGSVAKALGDKVYYTDNEMFAMLIRLCKKEYGDCSPTTLNKDAKIEVAKRMHYEYNSSNKQIERMLRLEPQIVDSLFPLKAHNY